MSRKVGTDVLFCLTSLPSLPSLSVLSLHNLNLYMALPRLHRAAFTPDEIEFIAGNETISIMPLYKMPALRLMQVKKNDKER